MQTQHLTPPPAPKSERVRFEFAEFHGYRPGQPLPVPLVIAIEHGNEPPQTFRGPAAARRAWEMLHRRHGGQ